MSRKRRWAPSGGFWWTPWGLLSPDGARHRWMAAELRRKWEASGHPAGATGALWCSVRTEGKATERWQWGGMKIRERREKEGRNEERRGKWVMEMKRPPGSPSWNKGLKSGRVHFSALNLRMMLMASYVRILSQSAWSRWELPMSAQIFWRSFFWKSTRFYFLIHIFTVCAWDRMHQTNAPLSCTKPVR